MHWHVEVFGISTVDGTLRNSSFLSESYYQWSEL